MSCKPLTSFIIFSFLALFFSSCISAFFPGHSNLWFYTYSSGEIPPGFSLTPASFLYLDPGKKFTLDFGKFQYGNWDRQGDTLFLYPEAGGRQRYLMKYPKSNEMKLVVARGMVSDFSGSPAAFGSEAENPFSL